MVLSGLRGHCNPYALVNMSKKEDAATSHLEAKGLLVLCITLLLFLSLAPFQLDAPEKNWLGLVGWGIAFGLHWTLGSCCYFLLYIGGWIGWQWVTGREIPNLRSRLIFFALFSLSCSLLLSVLAQSGVALGQNRIYHETLFLAEPYPQYITRFYLGGVPSYYLYRDLPTLNLQTLLSDVGIVLTCSITAFVFFCLFTQIRLVTLIRLSKKTVAYVSTLLETKTLPSVAEPAILEKRDLRVPKPLYTMQEPEQIIRTLQEKPLSKREAAIQAQRVVNGDFAAYQLPPPSLLRTTAKVDTSSLKKLVKRQAEILEETLLSFGIEAQVGEIHCGPTITSFEIHPAVGVKVQKIKTLENDIALKLQAKSIRIIAPIPGKAAVGVEIPSPYPQEVGFKDLLLAYQSNPHPLFLPVLLGKTVSGENVIADLAKMPHCLIAGATGSGKSVCINTLILSILMNARPDQVKLIMIDPKKVELTPYTDLPHMIAPVITEAHGAYAALQWLVKEMQSRYDILKQLGVRNISAFNSRTINRELEASLDRPIPEKMYGIVAIIDEFADLMMASSSDLETPIARIAQMARAVGIHLVLATQRPSREVITGLIKANFPTRIAFKVASRINSQIILDDVGAESLLGNGDLLFLPPGSSSLVRAQGVYISDEEISRVVRFICDQSPPHYLIPSFDKMQPEGEFLEGASSGEGSQQDTLYEQALAIVVDTQTASTTFLQRKLKIGYARAASLMDELERRGVIAAQEGAKPRRVLLSNLKQGPSSEAEPELFD